MAHDAGVEAMGKLLLGAHASKIGPGIFWYRWHLMQKPWEVSIGYLHRLARVLTRMRLVSTRLTRTRKIRARVDIP